jgi:hypothetical protein
VNVKVLVAVLRALLPFVKDPRAVALIGVVLVAVGVGVVDVGEEPVVSEPVPTVQPAPDGGGRHGDLHDGLDADDIPAAEELDTDLTSDLRHESGISPAARERNRAFEARPDAGPRARRPVVPMPACRKDFSGEVWSSRGGVRPTEFVLHYTVSANRPGWADVLAIENFFSTARTASSHWIVDFEAHCLKMVRERDKAWTQGNANPWALSVEIIATGRESAAQWRASPLIRGGVLARLVRNVMDRWDLPIRRVDPAGCVFPPGLTDHNRLECGNFHTDVAPSFPWRVFMRQLRALG